MNKSQEAFEAYYIEYWDMQEAVFPKCSNGTYAEPAHYSAFKKWQAAEAHGRKQALEDFKLLLTALVDASDYYAVDNIDQYHIEADAMKGLLK